MPVLVMYERRYDVLFAHRVEAKGVNTIILNQLCADLNLLGIKRATFKSDQEPSIRALFNALQVQWQGELVPETAPKGDKDRNGSAEVAVKTHEALCRT